MLDGAHGAGGRLRRWGPLTAQAGTRAAPGVPGPESRWSGTLPLRAVSIVINSPDELATAGFGGLDLATPGRRHDEGFPGQRPPACPAGMPAPVSSVLYVADGGIVLRTMVDSSLSPAGAYDSLPP